MDRRMMLTKLQYVIFLTLDSKYDDCEREHGGQPSPIAMAFDSVYPFLLQRPALVFTVSISEAG